MKKIFTVLFTILIISMLVIGCSDEENRTKEKDIAEIETAEKTEENEFGKEGTEEEIYWEKMNKYRVRVEDGIDEMLELFENADLEDSFWQKDMKKIVLTIKTNANKIMKIDDIPEKYIDLNNELYEAMNYFDEAMILMEQASKENYKDDDLLFQIVDYIEIGEEHMFKVDGMLNDKEETGETKVQDKVQDVEIGEMFTLGDSELIINYVEKEEGIGEDNETWIIIDLTWTNTSDETKSFSGAIGDEKVYTQAFQDGIELQGIVSDPTEENLMTDIRPDATLENVKQTFIANSDSEIELELSYGDGFDTIDEAFIILDFPRE